MCPGACPNYSLFVHGDGRIVYEGRRYVAVKGRWVGRISKADVKRLDEFYRTNTFLSDRYDPIASDGAVTKTSILADGKTKEVSNCHPAQTPEQLYQLVKMMYEISKSELWIKDRSGQPVLKP